MYLGPDLGSEVVLLESVVLLNIVATRKANRIPGVIELARHLTFKLCSHGDKL